MKTFNLDAMTKFDILSLLFAKQAEKHEFVKYNKGTGKATIRGIVESVTREDGSGNCFILTIRGFRESHGVFVRTID